MLTEVLDDIAAADAITAEWDDVVAEAGRPLSSAPWLLAWWRHAAPEAAQLRVVTVRQDGRLLGLAPCFFVREKTGLIRYRFLGAGTSLRSDVIARPGHEAAVSQAVAAALNSAKPRPSVIEFEGVSHNLLADAWPGRGAWRALRYSVPAPYADYAGTYDEWFAQRSSKVRAQVRRNRRLLDQAGAMFRFSQDAHDVVRDVQAFIDLHHGRWSERGGSGVLTPGVERMLLDAAPAMLASGCLRVWCLDIEDKPVSVELFLSAGDVMSFWLGGFDEAWSKNGPAFVALFAMVETTWGEGYRRLDLGGGDQDYKYKLAAGDEPLHWEALVPRGAWSGPARLAVAPAVLRRAVAARLSPERKTQLKNLLRRTEL